MLRPNERDSFSWAGMPTLPTRMRWHSTQRTRKSAQHLTELVVALACFGGYCVCVCVFWYLCVYVRVGGPRSELGFWRLQSVPAVACRSGNGLGVALTSGHLFSALA